MDNPQIISVSRDYHMYLRILQTKMEHTLELNVFTHDTSFGGISDGMRQDYQWIIHGLSQI